MKRPKITITLVNSSSKFYWDIRIGGEEFRLTYQGGTIETEKHGRYFFDTPYYGVTKTQTLFKLEEVKYDFKEVGD